MSELEQAFGSVEAAALHLNSYGCQVEDKLVQVAQYAHQLEQQRDYHASRDAAMSYIMTNPSELAPYYLELERTFGEIPVDQVLAPQQQQQPQQLPPQYQGQVPMSQFGARPSFPAPPNQVAVNKFEMLKAAPPTVAWKVLDQMGREDWQNARLVF